MNNREIQLAAEKALAPMSQWYHRCHEASVALVRSGVIEGASVARGTCRVVPGQHSWVVVGYPYSADTVVVDPTLWSYTSISAEVYVGTRNKWRHRPHGSGSIFEWGKPPAPVEKIMQLKPPKGGWSESAADFLKLLGPLDMEGWRVLAHAPVQGWPAKEILGQLRQHDTFRAFIPIDIVGMLLQEDCDGLYPRS